ncbi:MAG: 2-C-methyl-D-erythritol 4-phosphate cytidylyltransferase [Candidatus Firestonebacteria bacterium]
MRISVVIVAAGLSKRIGGKINKPYICLKGFPVIYYSISIFIKDPQIKEIILVIRKKDEKTCKQVLQKYNFKKIKITFGGKERIDSVCNGLKKVSKATDIVLIHDAARPFITRKLVDRIIKNAVKYKAVIPVIPVKDTVKESLDKKFVHATLDRHNLFLVQTPQGFDYRLIIEAYKNACKDKFHYTDDAMLVEKINYPVKIIRGDEKNKKITLGSDLECGMRF